MSWSPVGAEAFRNEGAIVSGGVRQINSGFGHWRVDAQAEDQDIFAIGRALGDTLDATRFGGKAEVHFRFAGVPGVARERVELPFGAAWWTIRRRDWEATRAVNCFAVGAPARVGVAALLGSRRCAIRAAAAHLHAGRTVGADLVGADLEAPVNVLGDGEKNPVIPRPGDGAQIHVIDGGS